MDIYVVQQEDNINSIAAKFGISINKLIQDNGLVYPPKLIIGQALVITHPKQSHTVQQGDTLQSIATLYNITLMQLLRNNSHLYNRKYLNAGESLVISYNTKGHITTNGFAYPFIKKETLIKTLPNLTYLSIFNYTTTEKGEIISYQDDDSEIIKIAKDYGVIPLLMLTTLNQQGEPNIETAYKILLNEEYQEHNINQFVHIMKNKGYQGINIVFNYLNKENQSLYENLIKKTATRFQNEGFLLFITINYQVQEINSKITLAQVDYAKLSSYVNGLLFLKFVWGTNYGPPAPVCNVNTIKALIDYVISVVTPDKIIMGIPLLGYDWFLPYIPQKTSTTSLSISSILDLAYNVGTTIQFDEDSQTPFFYYNEFNIGIPAKHIVWFTDARTIKAFNQLIIENRLNGTGIWNIMTYHAQLWTMINSQFDIVKL